MRRPQRATRFSSCETAKLYFAKVTLSATRTCLFPLFLLIRRFVVFFFFNATFRRLALFLHV